MYVRDHARPVFHAAMGLDPTEYDMQVFRITSQICRQVFPVTLDVDNPAFLAGLERLRLTAAAIAAARARGGLVGAVKRLAHTASAAATFARLYLMPAKTAALPALTRMAPAW
jgi:magnesium-protoporphyrin IX monomethyl ester (oxidative) cyclase